MATRRRERSAEAVFTAWSAGVERTSRSIAAEPVGILLGLLILLLTIMSSRAPTEWSSLPLGLLLGVLVTFALGWPPTSSLLDRAASLDGIWRWVQNSVGIFLFLVLVQEVGWVWGIFLGVALVLLLVALSGRAMLTRAEENDPVPHPIE